MRHTNWNKNIHAHLKHKGVAFKENASVYVLIITVLHSHSQAFTNGMQHVPSQAAAQESIFIQKLMTCCSLWLISKPLFMFIMHILMQNNEQKDAHSPHSASCKALLINTSQCKHGKPAGLPVPHLSESTAQTNAESQCGNDSPRMLMLEVIKNPERQVDALARMRVATRSLSSAPCSSVKESV